MGEWFWLIMTIACIVWYSTITFFVAYKGIGDIKSILKNLKDNLDK
jgi:hypothetical protein